MILGTGCDRGGSAPPADDDATLAGDDDATVSDDDSTLSDDDTTNPPGDDDTTNPPGDDDTTNPPGDDDTTNPPGDDDTTNPPGDDDASGDDDETPEAGVTSTPREDGTTPVPPTPATTLVDEDGDGFPAWYQALDRPEMADCDDTDPGVDPSVERLIPEGWFWRGNDEFEDTAPLRQLWLSTYCLDVVPVTNSQFAAFMNARVPDGLGEQTADGLPLFDFDDHDDEIPERIVRDGQGGYAVLEGYENHPVTEVYQWSGDAYCEALGKRLPTEAEWEKGARGDQDTRDYPWGNEEPTCDLANYSDMVLGDNGEVISNDPCVGDTVPVGSYPNASPYGLLDMTGNVAEFVSDFYRSDYYATCPEIDPQGPESGWAVDPMNPDGFEAIVSRGGVWAAMAMPVWGRWAEPLDANSNGVGFRCARDPVPSPQARGASSQATSGNHVPALGPNPVPATVPYSPPMSYSRGLSEESSAH